MLLVYTEWEGRLLEIDQLNRISFAIRYRVNTPEVNQTYATKMGIAANLVF